MLSYFARTASAVAAGCDVFVMVAPLVVRSRCGATVAVAGCVLMAACVVVMGVVVVRFARWVTLVVAGGGSTLAVLTAVVVVVALGVVDVAVPVGGRPAFRSFGSLGRTATTGSGAFRVCDQFHAG
jgi:hypothetical protein